jgi:spore germination protein
VQAGDTLTSIAESFGVTTNQLLRNNPELMGLATVTPGQTLVIDYNQEKRGELSVNGYAYPFIDRAVLRQTLPYLTYLTIFTYGFDENGELVVPEGDEEVVRIAQEYGVSPILLISTLSPEGVFSNQLAHTLLNDIEMQNHLIDQLLAVMQEKGYVGLDVDFEYVLPEDRDAYVEFIRLATTRMNEAGYTVITALAPKTSADQPGLLYEAHNYRALGEASNAVLLMTYEWGYTYGPPMAVAPINKVRQVLDFAVTQIAPEKIFMGIPNYGYDWTLPFVQGESRAKSLSNVGAVELAQQVGAEIRFDETAQAPFFNYYDDERRQHVVWFEDARSIDAKLALPIEYGLQGVSYWNVMRWFPQNWAVLNALYNIR